MPAAFSSLKKYVFENHGIWSEMGPYGSVWAQIKTGRSPMAHDHFWTPPDPKMTHQNQKKIKKKIKSVPNQPSDERTHESSVKNKPVNG